jgi:hypothetical protein
MARKDNQTGIYPVQRKKRKNIAKPGEKQGAPSRGVPLAAAGTLLPAEAAGQNFTPLFDIFYPVGYIFSV